MTIPEAIEILKSQSCYECSFGCDSPYYCKCEKCELKEAVELAIEKMEE